MSYDWMLDVLRDLSRFADENRMTELAQRLEAARVTAEAEIARRTRAQIVLPGDDGGQGDG